MTHKILRSVFFTMHWGQVLQPYKKAVSDFLGGEKPLKEFEKIGSETPPDIEERAYQEFLGRFGEQETLVTYQLFRKDAAEGTGMLNCVLCEMQGSFE